MIRWFVMVAFLAMALINAYAMGTTEPWSPEFFVMLGNGALWSTAMWLVIDDVRRGRTRYRLPKNRNVKLRK